MKKKIQWALDKIQESAWLMGCLHITTIETKPIQYLNYFSKMCCSRINKQLICCYHLEHSHGLFYYIWFCFVLVAFVSLRFHFRDNSFDHKNPRQIHIKTKYCSVSVTINKRLLSTHSWHRYMYLQAIDAFHSNLVI